MTKSSLEYVIILYNIFKVFFVMKETMIKGGLKMKYKWR